MGSGGGGQMEKSMAADSEGRKLFLGGLPFDLTESDLNSDFGKFGEIEEVQLPFDGAGKHKGFAFITFRDKNDCADASKEHHQKEYRGREISARVVVPRAERGGGGGGGQEGRPGDWTCPSCGANVFASKSACFKCGEPKRGGGGGGDRYGGGGGDRYGGGGGGRDRYDDRGDRYGGGGGRDRYDDRRDDRYGGGGGRDRYDDDRCRSCPHTSEG